MTNQHYDYFIIGQGLAGSILAYELIERGKSVLVLDNNHHHSASVVAAGLINPITGHRLNITDNFNQFMPAAKVFYSDAEETFGAQFFHELQQFRLLKNQGQYDYWQKRSEQEEYQRLLGLRHESHKDFRENGFGILEILQSGYVDVVKLLNKTAKYLQVKNALLETKLDYASIEYSDKQIQIGSYRASSIIFCEGYQAIHNPLLKDLPFKLSKGDVLTLNIANANSRTTLNWGNWLLALDNQHKLGSSYVWKELDTTPDNKTKDKLLTSLQDYTHFEYELTNHQSGIRPTTTQRQPFVGKISNINNAYCFNGFGSKACLLAPYYANQFINFLLNAKPLPKEVTKWL